MCVKIEDEFALSHKTKVHQGPDCSGSVTKRAN